MLQRLHIHSEQQNKFQPVDRCDVAIQNFCRLIVNAIDLPHNLAASTVYLYYGIAPQPTAS
jgi:hypothetical protein